jgi:hypothetical protein
MDDHDERDVTIAEFLSGRTVVRPLMRIAAGQRIYYKYRFDGPSFDLEVTNADAPRKSRDFRSFRECEQEG